MNPLRIPISFCPHVVKGKPRGYYLLAQRLFGNTVPHLLKGQFIGFNGSLVISIGRNSLWDSILKMAVHVPTVNNRPVTWLGKSSLTNIPMGVRAYIPGSILLPPQGDRTTKTTVGSFLHDKITNIYYLQVESITAEVLLGREKL